MTSTSRTALGCLAGLVIALLACGDDSALPYARLGIHASDLLGTPAPGDAWSACVILPVLRGSRVDEEFSVAADLRVEVTADRNEAVVTFTGASPPLDTLHVSRDQLEHGYAKDVQVFDSTGQEWLVQLDTDCEPDAAGN